MNPRPPAAHPAADDAAWTGAARRATANADVRALLRSARRRRHARWLATGLIGVAVGATVFVLVQTGTLDRVLGNEPAAKPKADVRAPARQGPMLDPANPFASTPAADWADGADGIAAPPATAIRDFTVEQVETATEQVRDVLIASRLDRRMLIDHDSSGFLAKLAPDARRQLEPLFTRGREPEVQSLVSMVAKGSVLLPVEPKVDGEMSVRAGAAGELVVHTNYVFVYAFEPEGPTRLVDAMNVLVVVRADVDYVLRDGDKWTANSQGLWYGDAIGYAYSIGCDAYREGYLAPAASERSVTANPQREPGGYFDPASPLPATSGCP